MGQGVPGRLGIGTAELLTTRPQSIEAALGTPARSQHTKQEPKKIYLKNLQCIRQYGSVGKFIRHSFTLFYLMNSV